jgi:hypothetical protein
MLLLSSLEEFLDAHGDERAMFDDAQIAHIPKFRKAQEKSRGCFNA